MKSRFSDSLGYLLRPTVLNWQFETQKWVAFVLFFATFMQCYYLFLYGLFAGTFFLTLNHLCKICKYLLECHGRPSGELIQRKEKFGQPYDPVTSVEYHQITTSKGCYLVMHFPRKADQNTNRLDLCLLIVGFLIQFFLYSQQENRKVSCTHFLFACGTVAVLAHLVGQVRKDTTKEKKNI